MSQKSVLEFLVSARDSAAVRTRYNQRNLTQLLFHAGNEGFDFTADDMSAVVGALEANVIVKLDADPFDGTSRLWRHMWGAWHLEYLVEHVVRRHTDAELWHLAGGDRADAAPAALAPAARPPDRPPGAAVASSDGPAQRTDDRAIDFLREVAARADVLTDLKVRGKSEFVAAADDFGYSFAEADFDAHIWDLEARLAERRGEQFDARFPLWQTMWGRYYLEYLVTDLVPSLEEAGLVR